MSNKRLRDIAVAVAVWFVALLIILALGLWRHLPDWFPLASLLMTVVIALVWDVD